MTRVRSIAVALSLALGIVSSAAVLTPSAVHAAEKTKMSKAVGVPLQAAQKAMANKQWDTALAEIKKAQAVEKRTPQEDYQIDEFLGYIYLQQKKYAQAAPVFERMLNTGLVPADQVDDRIKAVAQIYFQEKEDKKSIEWTKKWLAKHPGDEDMGVLLAQAYYRLNDYKSAAAQMSSVVANIEKSGQTPKENYLQIVLSSQYKQDNKEGTTEALKKLVRYYPSNDYWANLVDTYRRQTSSDRVTLGFYRLMTDIGILKEKGDFMEMSQLAIEAGVPGEAEAVMKNGMENGPLKSTDKTEQGRYQRLFDAAKKQAAADRPSLGQQAKDAEKASQGQPSVGVGQAYLSYGMYDEAIAAIQAGLKKGGVTDTDEAQISLGIALLKKGQKDAARQAFKAVKADGKWADLAALWVLRTYNS
jgi:tetratricopeptide (TPR) repeat protein